MAVEVIYKSFGAFHIGGGYLGGDIKCLISYKQAGMQQAFFFVQHYAVYACRQSVYINAGPEMNQLMVAQRKFIGREQLFALKLKDESDGAYGQIYSHNRP